MSLSINICPPDTSDKLSPKGEKKLVKEENGSVLACLQGSKNATDSFFPFHSKHTHFPSPCPLPDSPEAARREAIDYLAHKIYFVMF